MAYYIPKALSHVKVTLNDWKREENDMKISKCGRFVEEKVLDIKPGDHLISIYDQIVVFGRMRTEKKFYGYEYKTNTKSDNWLIDNFTKENGDPIYKTVEKLNKKYWEGKKIKNSSGMYKVMSVEDYDLRTSNGYINISYIKKHNVDIVKESDYKGFVDELIMYSYDFNSLETSCILDLMKRYNII